MSKRISPFASRYCSTLGFGFMKKAFQKVISDSQTFRQARAPGEDLNPGEKGPCRSQGGAPGEDLNPGEKGPCRSQGRFIMHCGGVGGTVASESALRSAGTLLSRV
ncbi:hypothetical protein PoB_006950500 [Plakobranchus ocellatus]|uniref:Uncharacterized protein n=1 Tax=Plakobranchus ocellatus TaxID=259542 RepID=A0AAV4DFW9_9GAST|nr:hypothetical protein PoB_006950500 [Plakobranchus ocellatus]